MTHAAAMAARPVIARWDPEDAVFWAASGRAVASRNLWLSIVSLTLSFAVWMLWSVVVVHLPAAGFRFSTNQLFWLAALPALSGATLRIFYSFAVPIFGGRLWSTLSTASLLVPAAGLGFAVQDPATPYEAMVALALLCGLGGGNFASSMAHVSFFYPRAQKGYALGMNAGLGNLGVPLAHALVPLATTAGIFGAAGGAPQVIGGAPMWLQNAGFMWVPLIAAAALAAWFGMDDLADARGTFADQAAIFRSRHNWLVCWLYLGTFGSFIGYAAAFPLLLKSQFPAADALAFAWLGPLLGALARPLGGVLADRLGGARVTFWTFVVMAAGAAAAIACLPHGGAPGSFAGLVAAFLVLFAAAGIGNGSTFRMIPVIFVTERVRAAVGRGAAAEERAVRDGNREAAAALGFASAISAYGGFVIPKSLGTSIALTSDATAALVTFIAFYITCIAITWWHYGRRLAPMPC
ncbi:MAG: NarK family nitrate/nitrite MFS transporter [Burkholderiales bacterium]|nr:NarK family nitrate/nitrite MFS transporter [Burkholderiales bacterium]